ncbi:MAG: FAD-dependent oxidoreductase, partial [Chloroflexi bacterium]
RVDDLTGGRFCALDGYGDPVQALAGMAGSAQLAGARLREDLAVESILREGDRVTGVRTREGDVSARRVLVAAGCWTSTVCATAAVAV